MLLSRTAARASSAVVKSGEDAPLAIMGHLYLFMNALIASSSLRKKAAGGSLRDFYIRESLAFIERHYHEEISVEEIAAFCNIDRSYLGKVFKSVLHTAPRMFSSSTASTNPANL
jgi:hypothetical protein